MLSRDIVALCFAHAPQALKSWHLVVQLGPVVMITKVQLPPVPENLLGENTMERLFPEPWVCQNTPPLP